MSVRLTTTDGRNDHVAGLATNGLYNVCRALKSQAAQDGQPWTSLIINNTLGKPLRVLSPNNALVGNPSLFSGYFDGYVDQVYAQYAAQQLLVDTQAQWGLVKGITINNVLTIDGQQFSKPSNADIFSCSTGPFANGSPEQLCITPRLSAAFNRGTLLSSPITPDPQGPNSFYQNAVCNHYARIVHEQCLDGRGYAFPYDDVPPSDGTDQSGYVSDGAPSNLTLTIGGS